MENVKEITEEIRRKESFKDVKVEDFAKAGGWADVIAKKLGSEMKTNQLRKVFNAIKLMDQKAKGRSDEEEFNEPDLYMLMPQLAYAKARKLIDDDFYTLIKTVINEKKIKDVSDFRRFTQFMTAIIAYHKQYNK